MRTSLSNIKRIEDYLTGKLPLEESLLFEAQLLVQPQLMQNLILQKKAYEVVSAYHYKKLKEELENIHYDIFHKPSKQTFRNKILKLFK